MPWNHPRRRSRILAILIAAIAPAASRGDAGAAAPGGDAVGPGEYSLRRGKVLEALEEAPGGRGLLLVRSPQPEPGDGETRRPPAPGGDLFYLSGVGRPGAVLLLSARGMEGLGREALFLPPPPAGEGPRSPEGPGSSGIAAASGIPEASILPLERLPEVLRAVLPAAGPEEGAAAPGKLPLYFDPAGGIRGDEALPEGLRFLKARIEAAPSLIDLQPPRGLIAPLRQVKSAAELRLLRRAIGITCAAQRKALRAARPGVLENQIAAVVEAEFLAGGSSGPAFPCIIGSGPNGCILHYDLNRRRVGAGELVLMDIGAAFGHYAADVTRTVPASGRFTERQRRIYEIVFEAEEAAIGSIRPGIAHAEVHRRASDIVAAGLVGLGLIRDASEVRRYLPHFTSHGVGLDVHDLLPSRTLQAGMVITVEPGIYIPEEGLGIRIEDDVLVTDDGHELLSGAAPRSPDDVERWINPRSY